MRMESLAFFKEADLDQSYIEYKKLKWVDFHLKFFKFNVPLSLLHVLEEREKFWALIESQFKMTSYELFNSLQLWFELKRWLILMSEVIYENATWLPKSNYRIISLIDSIQITSEWILWQVLVLLSALRDYLKNMTLVPFPGGWYKRFWFIFCLIIRPVVVCGRGMVSSMMDFVMSIVMGLNFPLEPSLV